MIDFAPWSGSIQQALKSEPPAPIIVPLTILGYFGLLCIISAIAITLARHAKHEPKKTSATPVIRLALAGGGLLTVLCGGLLVFAVTNHIGAGIPTFVQQVERSFDVTEFTCDPSCPAWQIPANGTEVTWIQHGQFHQGSLTVHGTRVGLVANEG